MGRQPWRRASCTMRRFRDGVHDDRCDDEWRGRPPHARSPREAEPSEYDHAARDRLRRCVARHTDGRARGRGGWQGQSVQCRRRSRAFSGPDEGVVAQRAAADAGRQMAEAVEAMRAVTVAARTWTLRRRWSRPGGGMRSPGCDDDGELLDSRGRARDSARVGWHPTARPRDRTSHDEGARHDLPAVRRARSTVTRFGEPRRRRGWPRRSDRRGSSGSSSTSRRSHSMPPNGPPTPAANLSTRRTPGPTRMRSCPHSAIPFAHVAVDYLSRRAEEMSSQVDAQLDEVAGGIAM